MAEPDEPDGLDPEMQAYLDEHTPDPEFLRRLDEVDALFAAHPRENARDVGKGFYFDADGHARTHFGQLRAVENP